MWIFHSELNEKIPVDGERFLEEFESPKYPQIKFSKGERDSGFVRPKNPQKSSIKNFPEILKSPIPGQQKTCLTKLCLIN